MPVGIVKSVFIVLLAVLNALLWVAACDAYFPSYFPAARQFLTDGIIGYQSYYDFVQQWSSNVEPFEFLLMAIIQYAGVGLLSLAASKFGYFQTLKNSDKQISDTVHFLLWPISAIWHVIFYFIYRRYSWSVAMELHIHTKQVMWAYWASMKYYYGFWILSALIFLTLSYISPTLS